MKSHFPIVFLWFSYRFSYGGPLGRYLQFDPWPWVFCHPLGDGFLVIRSRHLSSLLLQPTWGLSHKSQLFWCELQGYKVLTHCHIEKPPCVFVFPLLKSCTSGMNIKLILGRGWCDIQHNYERLRAKQWTICRVIERQLDSRDFQNSTVLQQIILSVAIHWVLWLLVLKEWPFFCMSKQRQHGLPSVPSRHQPNIPWPCWTLNL